MGPSRGGRVTAVAGHRAQPSTFYMGATGGGVWKTTNYGRAWHNVSDGYFSTGSIGAIRVAESDPNIVYVGTGSDGLRSNVIIGKGVYRSGDGGKTWEHVGLTKVGNIGAVLIHPRNPDLVYVAAIGNPFAPNPERGVYRTEDGGKSWERVLFLSERTGAVDLEFAPDSPEEIYATMWRAERKPWTIISGGEEGGVYKSTDRGDHWAQLTDGLPTGLRGKADLAVSPGDPKRVYVLIEAPEKAGGVYRSDDRGATWSQVTDFQPIRNRPFYYTNLEAHPKNPDILWGMAEGYWKSEDGGKTWTRQSVPHGDNHDMWINPDAPHIFIQSNDGGANVTLDGGKTWSTQHNQPTAELYQVDVSDEFPYRLYAGQQDNSTISVPSRWPRYVPGGHTALWEAHGGCETGPVVPKPGDPDIVYADCKGRFGLYNRRTGQEQQFYVGFWNLYGHNPRDLAYRFQRVSPIHVSPHDPNRVYHTSQYVHVTEDGGKTWQTISPDLTAFTEETQVVSGTPITIDVTGEEHFSVIYEIQESPHERGVIWVGANDGPIHLTRDGGENWKEVTPPGLGPYGRVQQIEVSPHEPAKAYAAILRYQLGDFEPHAYKTTDYGETWTRITTGDNGIPKDYPVRVVREDPDREGLLYAGTEFGMFISFDDGAHWQSFQLNLPVTPVTDIKIVEQDLVLSTMGRSFWILYDLTPLHEISEKVASSEAHLFKVKDPYRLYGFRRFGRTPGPDEPQYPPVGANIDYYLAREPQGEVRLEILNAQGKLIREFSSEGAGEASVPPDEPSPREWRLERVGTARLPKSAGLHRFVWNLQYPGPWDKDPERSGRRGPMVPPGTYQARLTVGEWSDTVSFEAKMDPRVVEEGLVTSADVTAQVELALQVRDALSNARLAAARLDKALEGEPGTDTQKLTEIKRALVTAPVRYSQPMILDQLVYLYQNLNRADQRPGRDAQARYEDLNGALQDHLESLQQILRTRASGEGERR
ncbi:MAG: WD40/YVTN/BNR-like repeat-containing protein [Acidobacteriota bacterium]